MSVETSQLPQASTFEWLDLDQLSKAPLRKAVVYWSAIRGDRLFPSRIDLKVRDLSGLLPYMSLVAVIDGGADFEHRIVGDIVVRAFNVPVQNRRFSEIAREAPQLIEVSFWLFRKVVETRAPLAYMRRVERDTFPVVYTVSEMVLLPLGRSDEAVDHIVGFAAHHSTVDSQIQSNCLTPP
jgi:hypothetical protein